MGDLLAQHPEIAAVIGGGGSRDQAVAALQSIDGLLADQNSIIEQSQGRAKLGLGGPVGTDMQAVIAKETASQLGSMKSQIQQSFGLQEGPSTLEQAQSFISGGSNIASDIFQTVDAGLQAISAGQNLGDILVRGVANTKDVMKIIDDFQTFITVAQKGLQTAGDITSFVGQFTKGGGPMMGDMGATEAAGQLLSLASQALGAINTGIDLVQESYTIAMKYVGRILTSWLGFPGAQDINYLLDTKTGQLQAYTSANPDMKSTFNTMGRMANPGNFVDARVQPTNQFIIYQGPGQDPRDTMNDAMFAVKSSGIGAFGYDTARPA
jgi:hypothetical protein